MKTNCKISKIIASLLVMSTILCFGATGFAASYSTVTTYNLDAEGTVDVTSTVTGIGATEQVTYLATNGAGDIIYVDQAAAEDIGAGEIGKVFNYTTTTAKIGSGTTAVKFGASTTEGITPNLATDGMISTVDVAVTAGDSTVSVNGTDVSTGFTVGLGQSVQVTLTPDTGYEVLSITVNGATIDKTLTTFALNTSGIASPSIVIETEASEITPDLTGTTFEGDITNESVAARSVQMFGKLVLKSNLLNTANYGIIILKSDKDYPTLQELLDNGTWYRAYGYGTDNMFAVKLISAGATTPNGSDVFGDGQYYAMITYLIPTEGATPIFGDYTQFSSIQ